MSKQPIIGSGHKGFGFEQKGFQERNLAVLLETLSKKETQKSIEALSKIKKDEWKDMATTAIMLNSFVSLGGIETFTSRFTESIKKTVELQITSLLSPLTNEINQAITNMLTPFITNILTPMINDLNAFLSENKVGAGIGGIVGGIAGLLTPAGPIVGGIIGAIIGALLEAGYGVIGDIIELAPEGVPYAPDITALYELETGNQFISIFTWDYIQWFNSRPKEGF